MTTQVWRDMTEVAVRPNQDTRWVRYSDVRMPVTVAEGESALDLISTKIANIEARLADNPDNEPELVNALTKWGERLAEVEWTTARLRAGEAAPSMDLARERAAHAETTKKLDAARVQVKSLESKVATLAGYRHTEASESKVGALRTELDRLRAAIDDRNATIERLRAQVVVPAATAEAAATKADRRREVERNHETAAECLCAIDSMANAGAAHTTVSRLIVEKLESGLPRDYRGKWEALHFPRIAAAAVAIERGPVTP